MGTPRINHCAVVANQLIYAMGGYDGRYFSASAETYDARIGKWQQAPNLPSPRQHFNAVTHRNSIYILGGCAADTLGDLDRFDTRTNTWDRLLQMQEGRAEAAATLVDHEIFVVGGRNKGGLKLQSMEIYNIQTGAWTSSVGASLPPEVDPFGQLVVAH